MVVWSEQDFLWKRTWTLVFHSINLTTYFGQNWTHSMKNRRMAFCPWPQILSIFQKIYGWTQKSSKQLADQATRFLSNDTHISHYFFCWFRFNILWHFNQKKNKIMCTFHLIYIYIYTGRLLILSPAFQLKVFWKLYIISYINDTNSVKALMLNNYHCRSTYIVQIFCMWSLRN